MFIFYFCIKQQDKHCIRHYDCDYECDYDKKNKIQIRSFSVQYVNVGCPVPNGGIQNKIWLEINIPKRNLYTANPNPVRLTGNPP